MPAVRDTYYIVICLQLGELERQELTSDPELEETLLPPSAPSTAQGPDPRYNLPNNFNFSNNNLFLDGASLLSPLDSSESNPANHPAFSDKAFQVSCVVISC